MSFSQNVRNFRLASHLTQEQLAEALGVSPQAVSKWETSETYPDGSLLLPLANCLHTSLDALFSHEQLDPDTFRQQVRHFIQETPADERFEAIRWLGWQTEYGLFDCQMPLNGESDLYGTPNSSYVLNDHGFTLISNGQTPFFSVFPDTGYAEAIGDGEIMRKTFAALSSPETMRAVLFLHHQSGSFLFDAGLLGSECDISEEAMPQVLSDLTFLHLISAHETVLDNLPCTLYSFRPSHNLIALLLVAKELHYQGAYSLQSSWRNKPFLA